MDPAKSRGRARGRARSVDQQAGPRGQGPRPGAPRGAPPAQDTSRPGTSRPPQPQPQPAGAWAQRPQVPPPMAQQYQVRAPTPGTAHAGQGRAAMRQVGDKGVVEEMAKLTVGGAGEGNGNLTSVAAGRGSVRGRRTICSDSLITRPSDCDVKQGKFGTAIRVQANYFELVTNTQWSLYQYRVDFAPDEDRTNVRKAYFGQAFREKLSGYIFDGTMMFTSARVQPDPMEAFITPPDKDEPVRVTIRLVGVVSSGDHNMIQFFNIIVRKCLRAMKLQLVGRNFFDALAKINIPQYNIELWPGYITSIRQHESKILMCCEIAHKFMRKENVLSVLRGFYEMDRQNYKPRFTQSIIGAIILTDYNNRTYRVDDVDWSQSPYSTFPTGDGKQISYVDYYKKRYQLQINDRDQPVLVSRAKPREIRAGMSEVIFLIPELCRMTGLTEAERNNMNMMRALAEYTRIGPDKRIQRLVDYAKRMNNTPEIVTELKNWDMQLANKLIDLPARILPRETIVQGPAADIKYDSGQDTDWTRNLRSNAMVLIGRVTCWAVICPTQLKRDAFGFVQALQRAGAGMQFQLPNPKLHEVPDDRASTYMDALDSVISNYNPNFILCVASNNKSDRYSSIKKKCCVDRAVATQVILRKNIAGKSVMSVATKVAIQINCKLGGAPWTVEMPLSNMMVVGFDVCHDTMNKSKSFGAMVASLDKQCTRYFSAVAAHTNGEELSNDFALNMIKCVKTYKNVNGNLPERIIVYRDGVGEGQLPYVFDHEVNRIKQALAEFYGDKPLKFGFIIVTKRINTRIFYGDRNPVPGTIVDDVITLPTRYDFFIVSQCVRQGTVSPTSYNVISDSLGLNPDKIQRLTYKFCHTYYNWSGTVRVPAPCQYAHKLAFLAGQALHRPAHPQLENVLYFL